MNSSLLSARSRTRWLPAVLAGLLVVAALVRGTPTSLLVAGLGLALLVRTLATAWDLERRHRTGVVALYLGIAAASLVAYFLLA